MDLFVVCPILALTLSKGIFLAFCLCELCSESVLCEFLLLQIFSGYSSHLLVGSTRKSEQSVLEYQAQLSSKTVSGDRSVIIRNLF